MEKKGVRFYLFFVSSDTKYFFLLNEILAFKNLVTTSPTERTVDGGKNGIIFGISGKR